MKIRLLNTLNLTKLGFCEVVSREIIWNIKVIFMKCPVCGKNLLSTPGHEACFEKTPSKFGFLKKTNPSLYASLSGAMPSNTKYREKNPSIKSTEGKMQQSSKKCTWYNNRDWKTRHVRITLDDVNKWEAEERSDILGKVQIDPTSYAPGRFFAMDDIEQLQDSGKLEDLHGKRLDESPLASRPLFTVGLFSCQSVLESRSLRASPQP